MSDPQLTLAMIVKNEAKIIERCLNSAKPYIDQYLIIDTGSTDDTIEVARRCLDGVAGEIREEPWTNFAVNRSSLVRQAREMANQSGFLLLLDADHEIVGGFDELNPFADGYYITMLGSDIRYQMPYLVNARIPWYYVTPTHEYLTADQPYRLIPIGNPQFMHYGDGGTRPEKHQRDLILLEESYAENPLDHRTVFYLAQTHKELGNTERAIELYRERADLGGWDQEVFWAKFQLAELTQKIDDYMLAWNFRPSRWEPVHRAMKYFNELGAHRAAWAIGRSVAPTPCDDILFVERWVEDWGLAFEFAIAQWWVGEKLTAKHAFESLLKLDQLPAHYRQACHHNLTFCQDLE